MPGHDHGAGQREGELAEQRAGEARDEADRRIDRRQRDGHGDDRHGDLARARQRRLERLHALLDVAVDVLDHDDGVVDDEADGQHQRQQRQQVDGIAERQQREHHADQRQRNGDDRDQRRAQVAEEQEDHHDDDQRRLQQRLLHLLDRGVDELGGVVGDGGLHAGRQLPLDVREGLAHVADDGQRIGGRRREDADEHGLQPVEHGGGIGAFRARARWWRCRRAGSARRRASTTTSLPNAAGLSSAVSALIGGLHEVALHLAGGGGEVVGGERVAHVDAA